MMKITFDPDKNARNVADRIHALVFVETKAGIRVVSFRKANKREVRQYEKAPKP